MPRGNYGWNNRHESSRRYGNSGLPSKKQGLSRQLIQQQKKNQENAAMRNFMNIQAERLLSNAMHSDESGGSEGENDLQHPSTSGEDPYESSSHRHRRRKRTRYRSRSPDRRRRFRRGSSSRHRHRRRSKPRSKTPEALPDIVPEPDTPIDLTNQRLFDGSQEASELRFREGTENLRKCVLFEYNFVDMNSKKVDCDPYIFFFKPNHEYLGADSLAEAGCTDVPEKKGVKSLDNKEIIGWTDLTMRYRFHMVRLDSTGIESVFRVPETDQIKIEDSKLSYDIGISNFTTQPFWEQAQQEYVDATREQEIDRMMHEARDKNQVEDRWVLEAKLAVQKDPKSVESYVNWLRAVEDSFYNDYGQRKVQHGLHEKKLGIIEQGLRIFTKSESLGNEILRLEKIKVLEEHDPEEARNWWKDLLKDRRNRWDLHEKYLDFLQYNAKIFDKKRLQSAFKTCRAILSHVWMKERGNHQLQIDIPIFNFNLWIRELKLLIEVGDSAEAIASIQASIERSFFYKPGVESRDSTDDKDKCFYKFWMSGAPRIGDEDFLVDIRWPQRGGFGPFSVGYNIRLLENEQLERRTLDRISEEMERVKEKLTPTMSDAEAYVTMERTTDNFLCRPLRIHPDAWKEKNVKRHLTDMAARMHHVPCKDLVIFKLASKQQAYQALHALGMEVAKNPSHLDLYTTLKSVSLPVGKSALSPAGFFILYRIYCHLLRLDGCQSPAENIKMAKNIVNYAVRKRDEKNDILDEALKLSDCVNSERLAEANFLPTMNLRDDQPHVMKYMVYRELAEMNLLYNPEKTLNNVIQGFLRSLQLPASSMYTKRFIMGFVLLAAQVDHLLILINFQTLELTIFKKYLISWLRPVLYPYLSEENLTEHILKFINDEYELDEKSEIMPSAKALAYCILIHVKVQITCTSTPQELLKYFKQHYGGNCNAGEHQEVIYTCVRLICHQEVQQSLKKSICFNYLNTYLEMYPEDPRGLRLAVWMLRTRSIFFTKNPLEGAWDNRNPEVRKVLVMVIKLARAGRLGSGNTETREMFLAREMNQTLAIAEESRESVLWKLAVEQGLDIYPQIHEKISEQCFYSKSVQLLHLENEEGDAKIQEIVTT